jgi:hypothetical protein
VNIVSQFLKTPELFLTPKFFLLVYFPASGSLDSSGLLSALYPSFLNS